MTSNALMLQDRKSYIKELARVMKSNSWLLVRTLKYEGDKNAQLMIKSNPGPERNTYKIPITGLIEKVLTKDEIHELYSDFFYIKELRAVHNYVRVGNKVYKRQYWLLKAQRI
jgi:hypothetical protein